MDTSSYMPTLFSRLQAGLQAAARPGVWWSVAASPHSFRTRWHLPQASPEKTRQLLDEATKTLGKELRLCRNKDIKAADHVQVFSFTRIEWLDVMDFTVNPAPGGGTVVEAFSWSSGVVPVSVPGASLINMGLFFFPFHDMGMNQKRLRKYRDNLALATTVEEVGPSTGGKAKL